MGPDGYYDPYRPPLDGVLEPAAYRPLGPGTLTAEHVAPFIGLPVSEMPELIAFWLFQGIGFEPAPLDSWNLFFDGRIRSPEGALTTISASFNIYFAQDEALLSYHIPIIDAAPSIAAASATLIPEPGAFGLSCIAFILTAYWGYKFRFRISR